ncbi:MAG: ATP-binding cassette domain-containing protein [Chthoniobacterales bacterium]|nr:ATP-binding cassette domain-containing protein [Chthoniobacterales bacterium]
MTAPVPLLTAEKVVLTRDGRRILDGVSLGVVPGRLLAVIGPNGAGKSSLSSVLSGWWQPDAGEVFLHGRAMADYSAEARARLCSVMRQESARPDGLTVLEAVEIGRLSHGAGEGEAAEIAWEMLVRMGLEELAARDCGRLSGGEWQRVAFARSVAQIWNAGTPGVLLLDEPVSCLDPAHQHRLLGEASALARAGHAVLAILHDLNLTADYADDVALLGGGRLRVCGPVREIMQPEILSDIYSCTVEVLDDPGRGLRALLSRPGR